MGVYKRVLVCILFLLPGIFSLSLAQAQTLGGQLLRSLDVNQVAQDFVARIEFTTGMQYVSHTPSANGEELRITLNPQIRERRDDVTSLVDERLSARGENSVLQEVFLDTSGFSNPLLILQFSESVEFSVKPGNDYRSITVSFRPETITEAISTTETAPEQHSLTPLGDATTETGRLYNLAREAFVAQDFNRAIQLATSAIDAGDEDSYRDSLELLGMAREVKGQKAHATAEYRRYIELYEKRYNVSRVKQRLDALLTAALPAQRTETGAVVDSKDGEPGWSTRKYGGFSQYYYNDALKTDQNPSETTRSSLVSDFNLTTRSSRDAHLVETQLTGSYDYDFMDDDPEDVSRVNEAYASWTNLEKDFTILLGRESRSTDGVQGRYDGVLLSKQVSQRVKVNLIAGYPVSSTRDSVETDRQFQSISLDLGSFNNRWDFNVYVTERDYAGLTDRRAIGGEVRYANDGLSMFGLVDYDLEFSELNTAMLLGNWFKGNSSVFFSIDHRKSPSLSLGNALLGQGDTEMDELAATTSVDAIKDLALAHTVDSTFATIGYTRTLNEHHQLSVDITASKLGETKGSEFLPATAATDTELFYNLSWLSNNVFRERDSYVVGYKYEDLNRHTRHTISLNARVPVGKRWKLNPKLSWSTRETHDGLETQDKLKISLNTLLRINRNTEFEAEFGTERIKDKEPLFSGDTDINYLFIGYRKYF
jgi:hypothetical protein